MLNSREKRAKINIIVSLGCQVLTIVCGLITPRLLLQAYGSEAYGMCSSITQFLGYITLLEGGIGGVARAALYKPLAENNTSDISSVVSEMKKFFRIVAYVFAIYVVILAGGFKYISKTQCMDYTSTVLLVLAISISTFGQYFIGISYAILLQAAQRVYINNIINISTTVLNTIIMVVLVNSGSNLIAVKLVSSLIFLLRPIALWAYVKKEYKLHTNIKSCQKQLTQKWSGLGQHIAYFLHSNTDIVILTMFSNLTSVAVYSVYNMINSNVTNLTMAFTSGMEAVFGDMLSKNEKEKLDRTFDGYEAIISIVTIVLFSTTAILIVPFVKIYTLDIKDANYNVPIFALILIMSSVLYCLRLPYHSVVIAAGHFKQTQIAAYGEAMLNMGLSIILVWKFELVGVAIATVIATLFRFLYYVKYLSNNILYRKQRRFVKRFIINLFVFIINVGIGNMFTSFYTINNYFEWVIVAVEIAVLTGVLTISINCIIYPNLKEFIFEKLKIKL